MADWNPRANDLFLNALDLHTPQERRAYLETETAGDPELLRAALALLHAHEDTGDCLLEPVPHLLHASENVGTILAGKYKLLEQIGEGGMGSVWMAEQLEPVRRLVALKLIRPGMDSRQVVARFEAERQALALMDHPNIARVLDAGATTEGRPYFIMELVRGIPITRYCDEHRLPLRERLALLEAVCQGVQHAHSKGIIHRDLKPSNVLVATYDDKPVPKIIDFGVAKAIGHKLTEHTLHTGLGGVVGTLEYMSPEQADRNPLDVDTRSDIYSLGVLLYELLTATTPITRQRLQNAALLDVLRLVREEEPPRPSRRANELPDTLAVIANQRQREPAALVKSLRGELDWITMKALEKERTRRYETASALARDITRYLHDEPVEAGPPGAWYRVRKFLRRHRAAVLVVGLVLVVLVFGIVGTTLGLMRALVAESDARKESERADGERDKALDAEADSRAYADFLFKHVVATARPKGVQRGLGVDVTVVQALEEAEKHIDHVFQGRPLAEARARHALGVTWRNLSRYSRAEKHFRRALELRRQELGPDAVDTLYSQNSLGVTLEQDGRAKESVAILEDALPRHKVTFGPDDRDTLVCMDNLAVSYQHAGRVQDGVRLSEEVVRLHEGKLGPNHGDTLMAMGNLALAYEHANRRKECLGIQEEALRRCKRVFGLDHPTTIRAMNNLALTNLRSGNTRDGVRLLEETVEKSRKVYGKTHQETLMNLHSLAREHSAQKALDKSIPLFEELVQGHKATPDDTRPGTLLQAYQELATDYSSAGKMKELEQILTEARQLARTHKLHGPLGVVLTVVGSALLAADRPEAAAGYLSEGLQIREKLFPDTWLVFNTRSLLGEAWLAQKKFAEAEQLLLESDKGLVQRAKAIPLSVRQQRLVESAQRLMRLYDALGDADAAARWRQERVQRGKKS